MLNAKSKLELDGAEEYINLIEEFGKFSKFSSR